MEVIEGVERDGKTVEIFMNVGGTISIIKMNDEEVTDQAEITKDDFKDIFRIATEKGWNLILNDR